MKKTILITGASTGIGKATALYFAQKGWNVAATMRTPEKSPDLAKVPGIKVFRLDVMDISSVRQAIADTLQVFGQIDVVLNNAGYALAGTFESTTDEQIKKQFETNVFGVMNVTREILPYFRDRKGGTLLTTTSMGGRLTFPLYSVYHSTKWAVEGFMESLRYETRQFNIRVKVIEPGPIGTEFNNATDLTQHPAYEPYASRTMQNMLAFYNGAQGPEVVAATIYKAAGHSGYALRYPAGRMGKLMLFLRMALPQRWFFGVIRLFTEKGSGKKK